MRTFEILIAGLLAAYLIWPPTRPAAVRALPVAAFIVMALHLVLERYRWQMLPIYALAVLLLIVSVSNFRSAADWNRARSYVTLGLLAVSTALPLVLPIPQLPQPSGPHAVGTSSFELIDPARREIYSGVDEPRRIMIQIWYPAEPVPGDTAAPWMDRSDVYGPAISKFLKLPSFFLDHLALVKTPAFAGARLAPSSSPYPLILFSHGWKGFAAQNSGQAIELASHGYVVVALQHTYGAITTVFPDGTVAPNNPSALPDGQPDDVYDAAAQRLAAQWSGDLALALDFMANANSESAGQFFTLLDLEHVGAFGHSTGGGAVIQFCSADERCDAVFAMDPFMTPVSKEVLEEGIGQPAFFMFSQVWADDIGSKNNRLFDLFYPHVSDSQGVVKVQGTGHHDFSDLPLLSPIAPLLGLKGPIPAARMTQISESYLLAFFDAALKGRSTDDFDALPAQFPEVQSFK